MSLNVQYEEAIARVQEMSGDGNTRWGSWRNPHNYKLAQVNVPEHSFVVPEWLKGVSMDWSYPYDNRPTPIFIIDEVGAMSPENLAKRKYRFVPSVGKGSAYYITDVEGIAEIHFHGPATHVLKDYRLPNGTAVPEIKATQQDQGYAGRHFVITMEDDSLVVLRGPWHGVSNLPYGDVSTQRIGKAGVTFGFKFLDELIQSATAVFRPEMRLALFEPVEGQRAHPSWEWVHKDFMIPKGSWTEALREHIKTLEKVNNEQIEKSFPGTTLRW